MNRETTVIRVGKRRGFSRLASAVVVIIALLLMASPLSTASTPTLDCSMIAGTADSLLGKSGLDPRYRELILTAAIEQQVDPLAMATLLWWIQGGWPAWPSSIPATRQAGERQGDSDIAGRGPWHITVGGWPAWGGSYVDNAYNPAVATRAAAEQIKNWGGGAGVPLGSIDQDFGKTHNLPSIATLAKNYTIGSGTWREPASAGWRQTDRVWQDYLGNWTDRGSNIPGFIDDSIMGFSFVYYQLAQGQVPAPRDSFTTYAEVAQTHQAAMEQFTFQPAACDHQTTPVGAALDAAWDWPYGADRRYDQDQRRDGPQTAKQNYITLLQRYNADHGNDRTDAGVLVGTVMRASVDPTFPGADTEAQRQYMAAHSSTYTIVPEVAHTGQLRPGDLLYFAGQPAGHTLMYTGRQINGYDAVSASLDSQAPARQKLGGIFIDAAGLYNAARTGQ